MCAASASRSTPPRSTPPPRTGFWPRPPPGSGCRRSTRCAAASAPSSTSWPEPMRRLAVAAERWPLARPFTISRGSKTETLVVTVALTAGGAVGRGEAVPYARYGESVEGVVAAIEGLPPRLEAGLDRLELHAAPPPRAARHAIRFAPWDLAPQGAGP